MPELQRDLRYPSARPGHFAPDGAPAHLPRPDQLRAWPAFTPEAPCKVLVSGCLAGLPVGVDSGTNGHHPHVLGFLAKPNVRAVPFCPENFAFGNPRPMPDVHGGDGHDVLDGRARVLTDTGEDFTDGMVRGAWAMLRLAEEVGVHLAILMDISAACGSQVTYRGDRRTGPHQIGQGVAAALLVRHGIPVVSQRDHRTLNRIFHAVDPSHHLRDDLIDHHEIDWYRSRFEGQED